MDSATPRGIRMAWTVAVLMDALQIGLLPVTGGLSTWLGAPLDLLTMGILWRLLGWHWALAPSFVFEFLPITELAPSWTLATWIVTRERRKEADVPSPGPPSGGLLKR